MENLTSSPDNLDAQPQSQGPDSGGESKGQAEYPPDHQAAMRVPKGGSICSKCEYLGDDGKSCTNEYFIKWEGENKPAGSDELPFPADEYCSDWFHAKEDQKGQDTPAQQSTEQESIPADHPLNQLRAKRL